MEPKDTYKYKLWYWGRVIHYDVTNDLIRRQAEHLERQSGCVVEKVGRRTTRSGALKWRTKQNSLKEEEDGQG